MAICSRGKYNCTFLIQCHDLYETRWILNTWMIRPGPIPIDQNICFHGPKTVFGKYQLSDDPKRYNTIIPN